MTVLWVVLGVAAIAAVASVLIYNGLVAARNRCDEAWSGIDVQLKRRHDLVPNLVAAVRGYASHERETLQAVTDARAAAMSASGPARQGEAESALSAALPRVNALAEQYPDLKASDSFTRLQAELTQLEDELQASRRLYNGNVQRYRTATQQFPGSVVAGLGHFEPREMFALSDPAEREVPVVSFA